MTTALPCLGALQLQDELSLFGGRKHLPGSYRRLAGNVSQSMLFPGFTVTGRLSISPCQLSEQLGERLGLVQGRERTGQCPDKYGRVAEFLQLEADVAKERYVIKHGFELMN